MKNYPLITIVVLAVLTSIFVIYQGSSKRLTPQPSPTPVVDSRCLQKGETGSCYAAFKRYYFEQSEGTCKEFIWGGCGGSVPFETLAECQTTCER